MGTLVLGASSSINSKEGDAVRHGGGGVGLKYVQGKLWNGEVGDPGTSERIYWMLKLDYFPAYASPAWRKPFVIPYYVTR
jgi:hypothetical protein